MKKLAFWLAKSDFGLDFKDVCKFAYTLSSLGFELHTFCLSFRKAEPRYA